MFRLLRGSRDAERRAAPLRLEPLEERSLPVVGATSVPEILTSYNDISRYAGVVKLNNPSSGTTTGTLIDDRHILTSAHNITSYGPAGAAKLSNGIDVTFELPPLYQVTSGPVRPIPVTFHYIDATHIHFDPLFDNGYNGDLGILTLDVPPSVTTAGEAIPVHYVPVKGATPFARRTTSIATQTRPVYTLVGYGKTGIGTTGATENSGQKRVGVNTFDATAEIIEDEIVSLRVESASGLVNGTFRLSFAGSPPTAPIPYNAPAQVVEDALAGLPTIGAGNVHVRNDPRAANAWLIDFGGSFQGHSVDTLLAVQSSLTGGSPQVVKQVWRWASDRVTGQVQSGLTLPGSAVVSDFDNGDPAHDALGAEFGIPGQSLGPGRVTQPGEDVVPGEASSAFGDSGAPALLNGEVAAVVSGGNILGIAAAGATPPAVSPNDGSFGFTNEMDQVAYPPYQSWINSTIAADDTGPYDLCLDMSRQAFGNDGVSESLNIDVATTNGKLTIKVTDPNPAHPASIYNGVYAQVDASRVRDLIIIGTGDAEAVTVTGTLGIGGALRFRGMGGDDTLRLSLGGPAGSAALPPGGVVFRGGDGSNRLAVTDTGSLPGGKLGLSQLNLEDVDTLVVRGGGWVTADTSRGFKNVGVSEDGVLGLATPLAVGAALLWGPGGSIGGAADLTISPDATASIFGEGEKRLRGVRLVNGGTVTVTSSGPIAINQGASVLNANTFNIQADVLFKPDQIAGDPGTERFVNTGMLVKSGGTGRAEFGRTGTAHLALVNTGLLSVWSGTLRLSGDGSAGGTVYLAGGGTLELSLGAYDFPAGGLVTGAGVLKGVGGDAVTVGGVISMTGWVDFEGGTEDVAAGGRVEAAGGITVGSGSLLTGTGTLIGTVTNTALIDPGADGGGGRLTIRGDYIQNDNGVLIAELDGGGGCDLLFVTGAATINGGKLDAVALDRNHFRPDSGTTFTILSAASVRARVDQVITPGVGPSPPPAMNMDITVTIGTSVSITYRNRQG